MFVNLKRCSIFGAATSAVLLFSAAFSPQWTYDLGITTTAGLREQCGVVLSSTYQLVGLGYCHSLSHATGAGLSKCCVGDVPKFSSFMRALETFSWTGAVVMMFAAAASILRLSGAVKNAPASLMRTIHFLNIFGVISFIIALVVALSMFDLHGPRAPCESTNPLAPCSYMGTAAITGIIALATAVVAAVCGLVGHFKPSHQEDLMGASLLFAALSAAFGVASSLTPSWVHFMSSPDAVVSTGLLQRCAGTTCVSIDYQALFSGSCHGKDMSATAKSRFGATLAMMIIGAVASAAAVAASALQTQRTVRVATLGLAFAAAVTGLAIIGDTYDSWLLCGETYSGANSSVRWGVCFGFAVFSAITLGLLLVLHLVEYMWFPSDLIEVGVADVDEGNAASGKLITEEAKISAAPQDDGADSDEVAVAVNASPVPPTPATTATVREVDIGTPEPMLPGAIDADVPQDDQA